MTALTRSAVYALMGQSRFPKLLALAAGPCAGSRRKCLISSPAGPAADRSGPLRSRDDRYLRDRVQGIRPSGVGGTAPVRRTTIGAPRQRPAGFTTDVGSPSATPVVLSTTSGSGRAYGQAVAQPAPRPGYTQRLWHCRKAKDLPAYLYARRDKTEPSESNRPPALAMRPLRQFGKGGTMTGLVHHHAAILGVR